VTLHFGRVLHARRTSSTTGTIRAPDGTRHPAGASVAAVVRDPVRVQQLPRRRCPAPV